ncbi:MAG: inositol monophosphatase family protein [Candidatus Hydrogenedentota bacterium]
MNLSNSYAEELNIAITAARAAGVILREAFNRPGGPIGTPGHAEADRVAEKIIWERLYAAFPHDGYLGEELPEVRRSPEDEGRLWIVDPNDGTSAYMRGFRGAATSIALLVEGEPVVGVVYAYNYPDDNGDLIAWAKGTSIFRNGQPVAPGWPTAPGPDGVVLVSQDADKNSEANATCVAPMRFRAVPGIAYRLALVAAGEGVAAVSLNSPCAWDFAGGHALLIGAGGDLFTQDGHAIVYDRDGNCHSSPNVFGGAKHLVDPIRTRDWGSVRQRTPENTPYTLCWPQSGTGAIEAAFHARAQGCLLGQLAGDALGSLVEFQTADSVRQRYPHGVCELADGGTHNTIAGQPTDDSEMALLLARSLIEKRTYDPGAVREAYAFWHDSGPFDCGNTIGGALQGNFNPDSQANGAMMRISPLGIFGVNHTLDVVADWGRQDAALTHPNPVCQQANALYAMAIAHAIRKGPAPERLYEEIATWAKDMRCDERLFNTIIAAKTTPPSGYDGPQRGWVLIALQNALWQLLHAPSLEEAVIDTVMRGGDTDTTAAICGALLGAVYGRDAVPRQWVERILTCRPIEGLPGVHRPRPRCFWPVDAMIIVDRLLTAG